MHPDLPLTDPLTGLWNRHGFDHLCRMEHDRTERNQSPGGLIVIIDIGPLDHIEQRLGPGVRDACINHVGHFLHGQTRTMDTLARWDKDEFAILLTGTTQKPAILGRVQQLAHDLNLLALNWQGQAVFISATIAIHTIASIKTPPKQPKITVHNWTQPLHDLYKA
jgi:diguanylate cyclase (GGDEF)-like protein